MLLNDDSSQGRKLFCHNTGNQNGFRLSKCNNYHLLYSSHINLFDFYQDLCALSELDPGVLGCIRWLLDV